MVEPRTKIEFGQKSITLEKLASKLHEAFPNGFGSMAATAYIKSEYGGEYPHISGHQSRMQFPDLYSSLVEVGLLRERMQAKRRYYEVVGK